MQSEYLISATSNKEYCQTVQLLNRELKSYIKERAIRYDLQMEVEQHLGWAPQSDGGELQLLLERFHD